MDSFAVLSKQLIRRRLNTFLRPSVTRDSVPSPPQQSIGDHKQENREIMMATAQPDQICLLCEVNNASKYAELYVWETKFYFLFLLCE